MLRTLKAPPIFESEDLTQRARMIWVVACSVMGIISALAVVMAIAQPNQVPRMGAAFVTVQALGLITLAANRRGRVRLAGGVLVGGLITMVTLLALAAGGVRSPGVSLFAVYVLMAGILVGERAGLITALVCAAIALALALAEAFGWLPAQSVVYGPPARVILVCVYMAMVLVLMRLANNAIVAAMRRVAKEMAERRAVESQLRQSQKMEALGTLSGGIAHDFNNIIAGIQANAAMGKAGVAQGTTAHDSFDAILAATDRASDIVNRILLFSRRTDGERKVVDVQPVIGEAIALLRVSLPKHVRVETRFDADLPHIRGNASQLFQVIMNLGTNALHAMADQGGVLSVSVEHLMLDDPARAGMPDLAPGAHVRVAVSDTGAGMSRETRQRLFEPFFTTKGHGGTGLGLSVVHGIVRDHDGAVTVDSHQGQGTTVSAYFPAVSPPADPQPTEHAAPRGSGQHIMYVDDDAALSVAMGKLIRRQGYRCTSYQSPEEALDDFRASPLGFDAVITDFRMPGMNGVELARSLREVRPEIPIALISAYGLDADEAADAGIRLRLAKPTPVAVLAGALRTLVGRAVV